MRSSAATRSPWWRRRRSDCADAAAARLWLDVQRHLGFDRRVEGEAGDADGGARMAAALGAEHLDQKVGGAVYHPGAFVVALDGIHIAVELQDAHHAVEIAEHQLEPGQMIDG